MRRCSRRSTAQNGNTYIAARKLALAPRGKNF